MPRKTVLEHKSTIGGKIISIHPRSNFGQVRQEITVQRQPLAQTHIQADSRYARLSLIKPATGIFITCLLVYLLTFSGRQYSIDGIVMFQYAKAILFDGSFTMDPPVQWGTEFSISKWPVGMTLAYIPLLFVLSKTLFAGDTSIQEIPYNPEVAYNRNLLVNRPYLYSSILNPLIIGASAVVLYGLSIQLGLSRKKAAAIALVYGVASPAAVYAKFDYAQPLATLFVLLALYFLLQVPHLGLRASIGAGVSMGIVFLTRPELAFLSPILAGAIYFSQDAGFGNQGEVTRNRLKNLLGFSLSLLAFFVLNFYINSLRFGSWSSTGYNPAKDFTLNPIRIFTSLAGNLISPGRGILVFFPLSWLAVAGYRRLRQGNLLFAWTLGAVLAGTLLLYSAWKDWGAGVSWGPRFFIPIMPYLALLGLFGFESLRSSHKPFFPLVAVFLLLLGWVFTTQGLLFNFSSFYGNFHLQTAMIEQGDYNFLPQYSPILQGWGQLGALSNYDIYWLRDRIVYLNNLNLLVIPAAGLFALGYALKSWIDFFRSSS
jgi:hypothetical protein